jgi:SAM-dependent methyltransferase
MEQNTLDEYLQGKKLYGDDFSPEEIEQWFKDEEEGYANLGAKDRPKNYYGAHALNHTHSFRYLPPRRFARVLSIGGATGEELRPLLSRIGEITILEPSSAFLGKEIEGVPVEYVKPQSSGIMPFPDASYDLATCFGCLHHVPNVSTVVRELFRCLRPFGIALIREPIVSMGDWRRERAGLTKRERGLPLPIFRAIVRSAGFTIVKETRCIFSLISRLRFIFRGPIYNSAAAVYADDILSRLFAWNDRYHCVNPFQKLKPTAAAFVLQKPEKTDPVEQR